MHSKWVYDNLVFYTAHRWYDAIGGDVIKLLEDFDTPAFATADNLAACTTTLVEGGAGETTVTAGEGSVLIITTDAAENDGANIQWQGESFKLDTSTKPLYFGCKFKLVADATQCDILAGLCITDTDLLGAMTDGIYFRKIDGTTTMNFVLEKNSTETATAYGTALAADTWYTVEFYFDGTNVDWYVNGVLQTRPAITNLPNDEYLTPSIHFLTGEANANIAHIDWIKAIQIKG